MNCLNVSGNGFGFMVVVALIDYEVQQASKQ